MKFILSESDNRERWYRVVDYRTSSGVDEYGESLGSGRSIIVVRDFPVLKTTPKGVWLDDHGTRRFVLRAARKRWACPTQEEAMASFIARKLRQLKILSAQVHHVQEVLRRYAPDQSHKVKSHA